MKTISAMTTSLWSIVSNATKKNRRKKHTWPIASTLLYSCFEYSLHLRLIVQNGRHLDFLLFEHFSLSVFTIIPNAIDSFHAPKLSNILRYSEYIIIYLSTTSLIFYSMTYIGTHKMIIGYNTPLFAAGLFGKKSFSTLRWPNLFIAYSANTTHSHWRHNLFTNNINDFNLI